MRDDGTFVVGNDQHGITIEICTRQLLCNTRIDTNCIDGITDLFCSRRTVIAYCQLRNLEDTTMRETNQCNSLTIFEVGSIDFVFRKVWKWENDLCTLSGICHGTQIGCIAIQLTRQVLCYLCTNGGILNLHHSIDTTSRCLIGFIQLTFDDRDTLLRKHLRRQRLRPLEPSTFLGDNVQTR